MIFSEAMFTKVSVEEMYKPQMAGFGDKSLNDFNPVALSSVFVAEKKKDGAEEEFIKSYLEAARILMNETYRNQNIEGVSKVFYSYSLVIPTLYLCRHCMELSIKHAIGHLGKESKPTHGLEGQWNAFRQYLPREKISGKECTVLKNMGEFVRSVDVLDDNGTKLRYPVQVDRSLSQERFMWANTRVIVENTEKFIRQMELLTYEELLDGPG